MGLQLMQRVEERAGQLGYRQLYLESGYAQPEALELYRSNDWIPVEEYPPGRIPTPSLIGL